MIYKQQLIVVPYLVFLILIAGNFCSHGHVCAWVCVEKY